MAYHVKRLKMIRSDTSYNIALASLIRTLKESSNVVNIVPETDKDIKKSFQDAIANKKETKAFANRLRTTEIAKLLDYKRQQAMGKITDFKDAYDIL